MNDTGDDHVITPWPKNVMSKIEWELRDWIYLNVTEKGRKSLQGLLIIRASNKITELQASKAKLFKLLNDDAVVTHQDIRACFTTDGDGMHFDPDLVKVDQDG